ncbi:MAG TPA: DUF4351 domain-containing protein, partial [Chthonomonadales bacterium]|nr:DUF4351 domain-containing protein [Chthonomonadales bacterium]
AGYLPDLPRRTQVHNALLDRRHDLPVRSVIILLRPEADGPAMTGEYVRSTPDGTRVNHFSYQVLRLWQIEAEELLSGGVGTLPLVPLAHTSKERIGDTIVRMQQRIERETVGSEAATLLSAAHILLGLLYRPEEAAQLLPGAQAMRESSTYQAILAEGEQKGRVEGRMEGAQEGRLSEAREMVLRIGTKRYGGPNNQVVSRIEAIASVERLNSLADRLLDAESWDELLGEV